MTSHLNFHQVHFLTSAPNIRFLPSDEGIEVAFAGRSNAGKSSALNVLCQQTNLARTSKTPGRTQQINVFQIDESRRLIDLPGYGYAKVPIAMKEAWQRSLAEYLQKRQSLRGLVVLMDIRHPYRDTDQELIRWAVASDLPVLVVLTKADKLKSGARKTRLLEAKEASLAFMGDVDVIALSSTHRLGIDQLSQKLSQWFLADHSETDHTKEDTESSPV